MPKDKAEFTMWRSQQKQDHGDNWNMRYLQPYTHGLNIGNLKIARISGEEYVGLWWYKVDKYAENAWMGRRHEQPSWMIDMSRRINAVLRHSVGCMVDKKGHRGLPCDEAGWVNVERFLKYDEIWQDGNTLEGTTQADYRIITERWNMFQKIIFTEYRITKRTRAQVLALTVTKGELMKEIHKTNDFTRKIKNDVLKIHEGDDDREVWLWPVAVRAPMAHSRNPGGVVVDNSKTSYLMNPSVGHTLEGGFHVTTFDCIARIFREGLRPGGGGDRINTFFVPFAPWDKRARTMLKYKWIESQDLVYIYLTYSCQVYSPRLPADGHIMVKETISFDSFDAAWFYDKNAQEYYRLLTAKGNEQMVLSVKDAKEIATIDRFDSLVDSITLDDTSPDYKEIRQLVTIKDKHRNYMPRLHPGIGEWHEAISLLALVYRPNKEGHRLCPACLFETPAVLSICTVCKGRLISHGVRKKTKVTVAGSEEPERRPQDDEVKDHVKQAWERVKVDLTQDDDEEPVPDVEEKDVQMDEPTDENAYPTDNGYGDPTDDDDIQNDEEKPRDPDQDEEMPDADRQEDEWDEEIPDDEVNIKRFKVGEVRNAANYPAWMTRIKFGSKVLPLEPCLIGDAQPELIKIFLLQMGVNLFQMSKSYHRNFCGDIETAWKQFQSNNQIRILILLKLYSGVGVEALPNTFFSWSFN